MDAITNNVFILRSQPKTSFWKLDHETEFNKLVDKFLGFFWNKTDMTILVM